MQESGVNRKGNRIPGNMGMGMNGIPGNVGSYRAFEKKSPSLFCWSTGWMRFANKGAEPRREVTTTTSIP